MYVLIWRTPGFFFAPLRVPRTPERMESNGIDYTGLVLTPPLGYLEFLRLTSGARIVLTDSGGIQEETTILSVPCLTLQGNTERPITIEQGTNRLVGVDPSVILSVAFETLDAPPRAYSAPDLWDGDVLEHALLPR